MCANRFLIAVLFLFGWGSYAMQPQTSIVVVAHKDFPTSGKTTEEIKEIIKKLFLRSKYRIEGGKRIIIIDRKKKKIIDEFYSNFVGKSYNSITDIKGRRVRMFKVNHRNLINIIKGDRMSVGYTYSDRITPEEKEKIKILFSLGEEGMR
ncbi:MAG: hypothetical protein AAF320_00800 [Myxococcota bacterium]